MMIILAPSSGVWVDVITPSIRECALSQDIDSLVWKLQLEVDNHEEILLAYMVAIKEQHPFQSPSPGSNAGKLLTELCHSGTEFHKERGQSVWCGDIFWADLQTPYFAMYVNPYPSPTPSYHLHISNALDPLGDHRTCPTYVQSSPT
jgi:hypothetical protein